jgi:GTP-dependent dephospho-CoA kinase
LSSEIPINERIRKELKVPLGRLIPDSKLGKDLLASYFTKHGITVCIGDRTTERVHELGFSPDLEIVDSLEKRMNRNAPELFEKNRIILKAMNPPGAISEEALKKLAECLSLILTSHDKVRLEVRGEEDLLALPVIAFFPEETVSFYGQPNVGLVIVTSEEARKRSREILHEIGIISL